MAINSEEIDLNCDKARALLANGLVADAITELKQALVANPDSDDAYTLLGIALCKQSRQTEGIDFFRKALEVNPNNISAQFNLTLELHRVGHLNDSLSALGDLLRLDVSAYNTAQKILDTSSYEFELARRVAEKPKPKDDYAPRAPLPEVQCASFWIRAAARSVDMAIMLIAALPLAYLIEANWGSVSYSPIVLTLLLISGVLEIPYSLFAIIKYGGPIGMHLFHIKVIKAWGDPPDFELAIRRLVGFMIFSAIPFFGLVNVLWCALDARKQTWHDKVANSYVVKA